MPTSDQLEAQRGPATAPLDACPARDELLHEIFEATADRFPHQNAVESDSASLTYRQLEERANRLARHLRSRGVAVEDKIVIRLDRGLVLYVAILGVLKAGATCVVLDPDCPNAHAAFVLDDCRAKLFITSKTDPHDEPVGNKLHIPQLFLTPDLDFTQPSTRLSRSDTGAEPDRLACIVYSRGNASGGEAHSPRGCLLEHRNLAHQARSAASVYGITQADRLYQGSSPAADAAFGEIWLAFLNGATLIAECGENPAAGSGFARKLGLRRVSVLSCAPTYLAMIEPEVPTLRIIVLGGEPCPAVLAARWHQPGRRIFNTYRCSEAGIAATSGQLIPNAPVNVGIPLPNYQVYMVGADLQPLPPGETGEFCIGGPGVARGYWNREELERAKFVDLEVPAPHGSQRVYRTGERGHFDANGDIVLSGGGDNRVDLRGFAVELPEIEAVLMQCPEVLAASVAPTPDASQLAAYVVAGGGRGLNRKVIAQTLSNRLPAYMIPSWLDVLPALPMRPTGAVDRRALPPPVTPLAGGGRPMTAPRDSVEKRLYEAWSELFSRKDISVDDDFFLDLGGDALKAAEAVSRLREFAEYAGLSAADLFRHPTLEGLAKEVAGKVAARGEAAKPPPRPFLRATESRHCRAGICQAVLLPVVYAVQAWVWLGSFLVFDILLETRESLLFSAVTALGIQLASLPALLALAVALKWLLLGKIRPGEYPLWSGYYVRFWFMRRFLAALPLRFLAGTPALCLFYRCMGVKIGRNVFIGNASLAAFDLVEIGDGSAIGTDALVDGHSVDGGRLIFAPVKIGSGCVVGNRAVVRPGASLADEATLADLSLLDEKRHIPSLEIWSGSPATLLASRLPKDNPVCWSLGNSLPLIALSLLLPLLGMLPYYPGLILVAYLNWYDTPRQYLLAVPLIAVSFIPLVCLEAALLKKYLTPDAEEGRWSINSLLYVRHWLFNTVYQECLNVAGSIFSTVYLGWWFKLLGAELGRGAEVATVRGVQPSLLCIGDRCRVGAEVMLGAPHVAYGFFTIGKVHVGDGARLGHGSVIPAGSVIGKRCRIGVLSQPPGNGRMTDDSDWFGSPAIFIPSRRREPGRTDNVGGNALGGALRFPLDALRILIPNLLFVAMATAVLGHMIRVWNFSPWLTAAALPFSCFAVAALAFGTIVILKWILLGRGCNGGMTLGSSGAGRLGLFTGAYENFAERYFLAPLLGTPFLALPLRLLGMRVGRRCCLESTRFTGPDAITLGDEVYVAGGAVLLTRLAVDANVFYGAVAAGQRAGIGPGAYLLPGSRLGDDAVLGALSLAMRGETLPGGRRWHGIPVQDEHGAISTTR